MGKFSMSDVVLFVFEYIGCGRECGEVKYFSICRRRK